MTIAYAVRKWLISNSNKEVYIITFGCGIVIDQGLEEFWWSMCFKMKSSNKNDGIQTSSRISL